MIKMRGLILVCCMLGGAGFIVASCTGLFRPPRPMFHDSYAAGGFGLVPYWIRNTPSVDAQGQWLCVDRGDNVLVIQATGTAEGGRSHPMSGGRSSATFALAVHGMTSRTTDTSRFPG